MAFTALTFDCYGTLIDWKTGIERALRGAFGEIPSSGEELLRKYVAAEAEEERAYKRYREVLAGTSKRLSSQLGFAWDEEKAEKFARSVPEWPAFGDTVEALKALGRLGLERYILSNVDTDLLEGTISNWKLEIDGFVTAQEVGSYKPAPGHWDEFFRRTSLQESQVLHVAQSVYHDVVPATRMGIATVWVNRYGEKFPMGAEPSFVVQNLADVAAILSTGK